MDSTKLIIGVVVVLLLGVGLFVLSGKNSDDAMMEEDKMMEDEEAVMKEGAYQDYAPERLAAAESDTALLFFYAEWCPTCRPLDADIKANENQIPAGVSIFKVDFDTEISLRQKYGVTVQHTIVQVGSDGEMIKKWSVMDPRLSVLLEGVQS